MQANNLIFNDNLVTWYLYGHMDHLNECFKPVIKIILTTFFVKNEIFKRITIIISP